MNLTDANVILTNKGYTPVEINRVLYRAIVNGSALTAPREGSPTLCVTAAGVLGDDFQIKEPGPQGWQNLIRITDRQPDSLERDNYGWH